MTKQRVKRVSIAGSFLAAFLTAPKGRYMPHFKLEGLPEDAQIVGLSVLDGPEHVLDVYVQSETFPEVEEGDVAPQIDILVHAWHCKEYMEQGDA